MRLVVVAAAAGFFVGSSQQAVNGLIGGERWSWAELAVYVVLWAVLMPPVWWLSVRAVDREWLPQHPSARVRARQSELVRPAMAGDTVPSDADPTVWRRALEDEIRQWNGLRWLSGVFPLGVAALVGAAAGFRNGNDWGVWAVALVVAAEGPIAFRWSDRQLRSARRLMAELAGRP